MLSFRSLSIAATLLLLIGGAGCKSNNEQASAPATEKQPVTVQTTPAPAPTQQPAADRVAIQGKVLETIDAASYTYVNVETEAGQQWVAIPATKLEAGQDVSFAGGMEMKDLESKTLGRTFDSVIFSSGVNPHGDTPPVQAAGGGESFAEAMQQESTNMQAPPGVGGDMPTSGGSAAAVVPSSDVQVDKAEGENGFTIGEIFAQKGELSGKKVAVRGKVMKVSLMIMGKNWIHLQDGTGDAASNTHDLVVTTMAEPAMDSVVLVEGTLQADRDFGSGYLYDVIIEDAEIK